MTTSSDPIAPKDSARLRPEPSLVLQAQKMEMVGRMASSVIHDLNNFLTVIQLNAALLEEVMEDPVERTRMIGEINRACVTAAGLTRSMLRFARQKKSQIETLELSKLLTETVGFLQCLVPRKAEIFTSFPETEVWIMGDRSALVQAFMNLVLNALDSGSEQGLQLTMRADEHEVEMGFTDFGSGISPEDLPHIFEPFFTTKFEEKGTGLGLAIVRQVVESHHGRITVETEWGKGTTFRIFLPCVPAAAPEKAAGRVVPASPPQPGIAILVVEDDAGIRQITGQILKRAGYQIFVAGSAEEAREIWATHAGEIALLLTDIVLPGTVSGEDLAVEFQKRAPGLAVLYMSGNLSARNFPEAPFISKPFAPDALIEKIRGLVH